VSVSEAHKRNQMSAAEIIGLDFKNCIAVP